MKEIFSLLMELSAMRMVDQTQHIYLASEPFESPGKGHTYREIFLLPV